MCAETQPWLCHRRLIADYLLLQGVRVLHILPDDLIEHHLSEEARRESAQLICDRYVTKDLGM